MDVMTALRAVNLIIWSAVLAMMAPAVWALWKGNARSGDPARLVVAGFALIMIGFTGRWLALPDSKEAFAALYVFSAIWAGFTMMAARSYGRGRTS